MKKVLLLIVFFSLFGFGHERHEEIVPALDNKMLEQLLGVLEKKELKSDEVLEKDALAIDWFVWLVGALELDTREGNSKLLQSLKALKYHSIEEESILAFWERDMRYIVNIVDFIKYPIEKDKCSFDMDTCFYLKEVKYIIRNKDRKVLNKFLPRIKILIEKSKGK